MYNACTFVATPHFSCASLAAPNSGNVRIIGLDGSPLVLSAGAPIISGRLEVRTTDANNNDVWQPVCGAARQWDNREAAVVCRQIGYKAGRALYHVDLPAEDQGRARFAPSHAAGSAFAPGFECATGLEASLSSCLAAAVTCTDHSQDAGIICSNDPTNFNYISVDQMLMPCDGSVSFECAAAGINAIEYKSSYGTMIRLQLKSDGNLVLSDSSGFTFDVGDAITWALDQPGPGVPSPSTWTPQQGDWRLVLETSGNLAVRSADGSVTLWQSNTDGIDRVGFYTLRISVDDRSATGYWELIGTSKRIFATNKGRSFAFGALSCVVCMQLVIASVPCV